MRVKSKKSFIILDELDKQIIRELEQNGKRSNLELGKKLGASEATIRNRINKLLQNDIIKIVATLNLTTFGFDICCVIALAVNSDRLAEVEKSVAKIPQIIFLAHGTGAFNLVAIALFRNIRDYDNLMKEQINTIPGITRIDTIFSWGIVKDSLINDSNILSIL